MDTHKRTILKSITWRVVAVFTTIFSIYYWTKSWSISLGSGLAANLLKAIFYYLHERFWNMSNIGRVNEKASSR